MQAQDRMQGAQAVPVAVVNTREWLGRGLYFDVFAVAVNLLSGTAAAIDLYAAGYLRASSPVGADASFGALARIGLEVAIFVGSYVWIAGRLMRAAYRELPRME